MQNLDVFTTGASGVIRKHFLETSVKTKDIQIGFRLQQPYGKRIEAHAIRLGISKHEAAREELIRKMENQDLVDIKREVELLRKEILELRNDIGQLIQEVCSLSERMVGLLGIE